MTISIEMICGDGTFEDIYIPLFVTGNIKSIKEITMNSKVMLIPFYKEDSSIRPDINKYGVSIKKHKKYRLGYLMSQYLFRDDGHGDEFNHTRCVKINRLYDYERLKN
jgi:hypothetical protein